MKNSPLIWRCLLLISWLAIASNSHSHSGGLDNTGGHTNKQTGEYHCHTAECQESISIKEGADTLKIASFNIQFLGHFKQRDDDALAALMAPYDIVLIQELIAPPFAGQFPDNSPYKPDNEAREFFDAMSNLGFDYHLSEEDTGTNDINHRNNTSTEWWVSFYKPEMVELIETLPNGFLASDRTNHNDYERVPYATSFRTISGNDFVLVSVHLQPGDRNSDRDRRQHELDAIAKWVDANDDVEKDFFILGDMNFENCQEIMDIVPSGYQALNTGPDCVATNTNLNGPRPYDNILFPSVAASELSEGGHFHVVNLIKAMRVSWYDDFSVPYPGDKPYNHTAFRQRYSDHHPVVFHLNIRQDDD